MKKNSMDDSPESPSRTSQDESSEEDAAFLQRERATRIIRRHRTWTYIFGTGNILFFVLNVALFLNFRAWLRKDATKSVLDTRFDGLTISSSHWTAPAIKYELHGFDDEYQQHLSPYRGEKRPELDRAWQDLVRGTNIRVPAPGFAPATDGGSWERKIVDLHDNVGGLMGMPAYVHNLHCLKVIRQYVQPEAYPEIAERYKPPPGKLMSTHIDHCIDELRQSELCHADMTIFMFEWQEEFELPQSHNGTQHICADRDRLDGWIKNHEVRPQNGMIVNPWTGQEPYREGELRDGMKVLNADEAENGKNHE
ncbi:hypothetical protein PVAG01_08586 [Phlyctema vagabunda]|uniref:Tat pathway signal sequence n=1 Tax=Phlyctema vagabunda TaxID=108571 RepID=A0ABR4PA05_9HELO